MTVNYNYVEQCPPVHLRDETQRKVTVPEHTTHGK